MKKVKKIDNMITILFIVLCCAYCFFKNFHSNHKILELSDIESLKKENLTIESSTKDFSGIVEKVINLKKKIENEINNINELYEKTISIVTKSFEQKYEKLKKEEKDIIDKLQNKVTKTKEKLENVLTEINCKVNISERITKCIKKFEKEEKNLIKTLSYVSAINKNQKEIQLLINEPLKSLKTNYKEEENNIIFDEFYFYDGFNSKLKSINKGNCEVDYGKNGRLLFDLITDKVYFAYYLQDKVDVYENYENLKIKKLYKTITLSKKIAGSYPVFFKGYLYYFENKNRSSNNLIKYDLNENKIINERVILPDAILDNNQNIWGGYNDIILISDNIQLYAIYSSSNNNKRITIAKIDDNNLDIIKIWNTESLEKGKCGPIFIINNILYHIKTYSNQNDSVIYSYNLLDGKNSNINIPFENKGGYDYSLTYYPNLKCLMTVNNYKIYKYEIVFDNQN